MGILIRPLDAILSSQSKVRLLRALLPLETGVSAREAARLAGVPPAPALRALADLVHLGILQRVELPSQHLYTVNRENSLVPEGLEPLFNAERARLSQVFGALRDELRDEVAEGVLLTLAIFGSAARGTDHSTSDLDVLAVAQQPDHVAVLHDRLVQIAPKFERRFGLDLSPVVMSQAQLHQECTNQDSAIANALKDARVIAGLSLDRLLAMQEG